MSLFRYDPPAGSLIEGIVRVAVDGPVVCRACGCRLEGPGASADPNDLSTTWRHFEGLPGRDARGCRVVCVDAIHGADGYVLA
jgi:hypothetical protein